MYCNCVLTESALQRQHNIVRISPFKIINLSFHILNIAYPIISLLGDCHLARPVPLKGLGHNVDFKKFDRSRPKVGTRQVFIFYRGFSL